MQENFKQSKSVTYWLLGSQFVIPWVIEDPLKVHAEVTFSDGGMKELTPEIDFHVDAYECILILTSQIQFNENTTLRIFEGKQQSHKVTSNPYLSAPHHLVIESDLHPVHARLDGVETAVKDSSTVIQEKVKKLDSLSATAEDLSAKVQDLAVLTKNTQQKIDQIDLSKIEGLDPETRKYLRRLQNQVSASAIKVAYNSDEGRSDRSLIAFQAEDGTSKGEIACREGAGFKLGRLKPDGYYSSWITLSPNGDVSINGSVLAKGSDSSIFDTIAKKLMPSFLSLLQDRTAIRCAVLKDTTRGLNDIIGGKDIEKWGYPSENSGGFLSSSAGVYLYPADSDLTTKWIVRGVTDSYYQKWHWLQEVINPDNTFVLKTVGSSTLADNFVDLTAMQRRLASVETSTTLTKAEVASNKADVIKTRTEVKSISDKATSSSDALVSLQKRLDSLEQRIQGLEPLKEKFDKDGDLILAQKTPQHKPSITFADMNGKPTNYLFAHGDNFFIAKADEDGNMGTRINLAPEKLTIDNHTIQEYIKEALRHRTGVFAASLKPGVAPRLWDTIRGEDVLAWQYPCESNGRMNSGWHMLTPGEDTWSKRWRVWGRSDWESSPSGRYTYYLQEDI